MANILYRGTIAPTQPPAVAGGSVAKNSPLTNDEGDWNYKALNDDIQTRATSANPSFTGITSFEYNLRSVLAKYNKYVAGGFGATSASGHKIGEYLPNANNQTATIYLDVVGRSNAIISSAKATIAIRSNSLPSVDVSTQVIYSRNNTTTIAIETWRDNSTGRIVFFLVPGSDLDSVSIKADVFERNAVNLFSLSTSAVPRNVAGLTQVANIASKTEMGDLVTVSVSGNGSGLTDLNASNIASGTLSGDRGVAAGSTSKSFVAYNGTTQASGKFDSGTTDPTSNTRLNYNGDFYATKFYATKFYGTGATAGDNVVSFVTYNTTAAANGVFYGGTTVPSGTTRLNYGGYFYATKFYGDGSSLTNITTDNISAGTLPIGRGGTGGTTGATAMVSIDRNRQSFLDSASHNVTLSAGVVYSAYSGYGSFTIYLPNSPTIGDEITLTNLYNAWSDTNKVTVALNNPAHYISGCAPGESLVLNSTKARSVKLRYSWSNFWNLEIG